MESNLLNVIGKVYDVASSNQDWNPVLEDIADICGGEAAQMLMVSPKAQTATVVSPRTDPSFIKAFFADWADEDPTYSATIRASVGEVVTLENSGRETFLKSAFYNVFWKGSGLGAERMRSNLIMNDSIQVGIGLSPFARRDEISEHMHKTFLALLPHMIRSVELQWRMHRLELERAMVAPSGTAGVLIVNSDGRVLVADTRAEEILSAQSPLLVEKGVLHATENRDTVNLHRMILSCAPRGAGYQLRGGSVRIGYPGGSRLDIAIMPVPAEASGFPLDVDSNRKPVATILLKDIESGRRRTVEKLQTRYGLTQAEARVALECLKGETRDALARSMGVSDATIRTHLSRIYEKTGAKRRTQLVHLLHQDGFSG